jgi:hypothetical protein
MTTTDVTISPQLQSISLNWSTTGYYITPPTVIANISAWGLFQAEQTLNGGTISYKTYSSSFTRTSAYLQNTATFVSQPNNSTIVVSTKTYIYTKATYAITLGTQTPSVDSITYNWISGAATTLDMTATWKDERMYLGIQRTVDSSRNDGVIVFDPKLNAWWEYKSGVYPAAMYRWKNKFLVASSSFGCVSEMFQGNTDLGADINAYYYTNQMSPKPLNQISSLTNCSVIFKRGTGILNLDYFLNGSSTSEATLPFTLSGGTPLRVKSFNFPEKMNTNFFQFKISNVNGCDFTFYNLLGTTVEIPLRISQ